MEVSIMGVRRVERRENTRDGQRKREGKGGVGREKKVGREGLRNLDRLTPSMATFHEAGPPQHLVSMLTHDG